MANSGGLFKSEKFNSRRDEEKSKWQLSLEDIEQSVFSVFYLLLKNQETTYWKFIALLIIEYIQLLSFSFDSSVSLFSPLSDTFCR